MAHTFRVITSREPFVVRFTDGSARFFEGAEDALADAMVNALAGRYCRIDLNPNRDAEKYPHAFAELVSLATGHCLREVEARARDIYNKAVKALGVDLSGGSLTDLLCDNMDDISIEMASTLAEVIERTTVATCGCCRLKDDARRDAFGRAYGCVCENHTDIPNGVKPGRCRFHREVTAR